jgi:thiol-disulfide isomerase/thioredoxin
MIDKPESGAYLKAKARRIMIPLTCAFLGLFLLLGLTGQSLAGAVQDANPGREGQTVDLKSLPVKGKTTVVDCYSPYCPPCMRLAPLLEELAQKRPDLVIKKLNIQRPEISGKIDWQSPAAKQLSLRSVPHFMIFDKNGKAAAEGKEAFNQVLGWLQEAGLLKK